jgi:hypothetical protein
LNKVDLPLLGSPTRATDGKFLTFIVVLQ